MSKHILTLPVPGGWEACLEDWSVSMLAAGRSSRTVSTRVQHIRQLARGLSVEDPIKVEASQLLEWCASRLWAPETRHAYYQSFAQFFLFVCGSDSPAASLPRVRRPVRKSRPTPEIVLKEALAEADERVWFILRLAIEGGLRAHEIAAVHRRRIQPDLVGFSLEVRGKGGRVRHIPLSTGFAHQLMDFAERNGGYAFPGQIEGHLAPQTVTRLAGRVLPPPWTLHSVRHRFANAAFSSSKDIVAVQELLGHASIETTRSYLVANEEAMRLAASGTQMSLAESQNAWEVSLGGYEIALFAVPLRVSVNGVDVRTNVDELATLSVTVNEVLRRTMDASAARAG